MGRTHETQSFEDVLSPNTNSSSSPRDRGNKGNTGGRGGSRAPPVSLRVAVTLVCAIILAVVAVCTVTISFELSRKALIDVGKSHATSVLEGGLNQVQEFLNQPAAHSRGMQSLVRQVNEGKPYMNPADDPDPELEKKWHRVMEFPMLASNFTYFHAWLQTEDGGIGRTRLFANDTIASYYFHSWAKPSPINVSEVQRVIETQQEPAARVKYPFPTRNGRNFAYWDRAIGHSKMQVRKIFWDNIALTAFPQRQILTVACSLHNSTDNFLGHASIGFDIRQMNDFMRHLDSHSFGTTAIVTDTNGFVIASSLSEQLPTQFTPCFNTTCIDEACVEKCDLPPGGQCSKTPPTAPNVGIMCRYHATKFLNADVREATAKIPATYEPGTDNHVHSIKLSSGKYFVAYGPVILREMHNMGFRVILIIPEQSVLGGIFEARDVSIVAAVLCLVVGTAITFLSVFYFLSPLKEVANSIATASRLSERHRPMKRSKMNEIWMLQQSFEDMILELHYLRKFVPQAMFGDEHDRQASLGSLSAHSSSAPPTNPFLPSVSGEVATGGRKNFSRDFSGSERDDSINDQGTSILNINVLQSEHNVFSSRRFSVLHFQCSNVESRALAELEEYAMMLTAIAIPAVRRAGGVIESFQVSTFTVTFNAHKKLKRHESAAVKCAREIESGLLSRMGNRCVFSIFVDTTDGAVGTVGNDEYACRTVISEGVEFSRKMHSLMVAHLNATLLLSDRIARATTSSNHNFELVPIDCVNPFWLQKNRAPTVILYRILNKNDYPKAALHQFKESFSMLASGKGELKNLYANFDALHNEVKLPDAKRLALQCNFIAANKDRSGSNEQKFAIARKELAMFEDLGNQNLLLEFKARTDMENELAEEGETEKAKEAQRAMTQLKQQQQNVFSEETTDGLIPLMVEKNDLDSQANLNSVGQENTDLHGLPTVIKDTQGTTWRRSREVVASGTFSSVYRGLNEEGYIAALKFLPLNAYNTTIEAIVEEVNLFATLIHDNICQYHGCSVTENHVVIITEMVATGSLQQLLGSFGTVSLGTLKRFARDMLCGLAHLHENKVVHADIKPHNILLDADGVCKLTDFGTALSTKRSEGEENSNGCSGSGGFSLRGTIGTAHYMAPEVAAGEEPTASSDIWSFGVTLLHLYLGQLPFDKTLLQMKEYLFIKALAVDENVKPSISTSARGQASSSHSQPSRGRTLPERASDTRSHTTHRSHYDNDPQQNEEDFYEFWSACCVRDPKKRPTAAALKTYRWLL